MSQAGRPSSASERQRRFRLRQLRQGLPADAGMCRSKEDYMRWHEAAAAEESLRRNEDPEQVGQRRERARRYAAWRWDAVLVGEVALL